LHELIIHHIPVCPFSQRLEILLALKGLRDRVRFTVVDITKPRDPALLAKTRGTTALPVLELPDGRVLKESLVLLQYLEDLFPEPRVAQHDPYRRAVEGMMVRLEGDFVTAGYVMVMNQDLARRDALRDAMLKQYARLDAFLMEHAPEGTFLFEDFGWAEAVFTPFFMRFWFLDYYEGFALPDDPGFARVRRWREYICARSRKSWSPDDPSERYAKNGCGLRRLTADARSSRVCCTKPPPFKPLPSPPFTSTRCGSWRRRRPRRRPPPQCAGARCTWPCARSARARPS
jgi:glutathione S-transferase